MNKTVFEVENSTQFFFFTLSDDGLLNRIERVFLNYDFLRANILAAFTNLIFTSHL